MVPGGYWARVKGKRNNSKETKISSERAEKQQSNELIFTNFSSKLSSLDEVKDYIFQPFSHDIIEFTTYIYRHSPFGIIQMVVKS